MKGIEKLKSGDFHVMTQKEMPDGSILVTLSKREENETHEFVVKNLYKKNEKILSEKTLKKEKGFDS